MLFYLPNFSKAIYSTIERIVFYWPNFSKVIYCNFPQIARTCENPHQAFSPLTKMLMPFSHKLCFRDFLGICDFIVSFYMVLKSSLCWTKLQFSVLCCEFCPTFPGWIVLELFAINGCMEKWKHWLFKLQLSLEQLYYLHFDLSCIMISVRWKTNMFAKLIYGTNQLELKTLQFRDNMEHKRKRLNAV